MTFISIKEIGPVFKAMGIVSYEPKREICTKWLNDFDSNRKKAFSLNKMI